MNREILEILACPIDKFHPLDLFECKTEIEKIIEGVLYCKKCSRFFPIICLLYTSPSPRDRG